MSKSKKKDNTKSIPVLKRKHVRTMEVPILKLDKDISLDSPDLRTAVTKAVSESINKAIPTIVEQVLEEIESQVK